MTDPVLAPISTRPAAAALTGAELLAVVQGGTTKRATALDVSALTLNRDNKHTPLPTLNGSWMLATGLNGPPAFGTIALTFGTTLFVPLAVGHTISVVNLAIEVTTANTSLGLAIYGTDAATGAPSTLVAGPATVSTTTIGVKTQAMPVQLQPGLYWIAIAGNGSPAPTLRSQSAGMLPLGVATAGGQTPITAYRAATSTLPSPASPASTNITGAIPAVWLQYTQG